jgi:hypothetical protein
MQREHGKSGQVLGSNVGNEVFYGALYYGLKVPPGTAAHTKR